MLTKAKNSVKQTTANVGSTNQLSFNTLKENIQSAHKDRVDLNTPEMLASFIGLISAKDKKSLVELNLLLAIVKSCPINTPGLIALLCQIISSDQQNIQLDRKVKVIDCLFDLSENNQKDPTILVETKEYIPTLIKLISASNLGNNIPYACITFIGAFASGWQKNKEKLKKLLHADKNLINTLIGFLNIKTKVDYQTAVVTLICIFSFLGSEMEGEAKLLPALIEFMKSTHAEADKALHAIASLFNNKFSLEKIISTPGFVDAFKYALGRKLQLSRPFFNEIVLNVDSNPDLMQNEKLCSFFLNFIGTEPQITSHALAIICKIIQRTSHEVKNLLAYISLPNFLEVNLSILKDFSGKYSDGDKLIVLNTMNMLCASKESADSILSKKFDFISLLQKLMDGSEEQFMLLSIIFSILHNIIVLMEADKKTNNNDLLTDTNRIRIFDIYIKLRDLKYEENPGMFWLDLTILLKTSEKPIVEYKEKIKKLLPFFNNDIDKSFLDDFNILELNVMAEFASLVFLNFNFPIEKKYLHYIAYAVCVTPVDFSSEEELLNLIPIIIHAYKKNIITYEDIKHIDLDLDKKLSVIDFPKKINVHEISREQESFLMERQKPLFVLKPGSPLKDLLRHIKINLSLKNKLDLLDFLSDKNLIEDHEYINDIRRFLMTVIEFSHGNTIDNINKMLALKVIMNFARGQRFNEEQAKEFVALLTKFEKTVECDINGRGYISNTLNSFSNHYHWNEEGEKEILPKNPEVNSINRFYSSNLSLSRYIPRGLQKYQIQNKGQADNQDDSNKIEFERRKEGNSKAKKLTEIDKNIARPLKTKPTAIPEKIKIIVDELIFMGVMLKKLDNSDRDMIIIHRLAIMLSIVNLHSEAVKIIENDESIKEIVSMRNLSLMRQVFVHDFKHLTKEEWRGITNDLNVLLGELEENSKNTSQSKIQFFENTKRYREYEAIHNRENTFNQHPDIYLGFLNNTINIMSTKFLHRFNTMGGDASLNDQKAINYAFLFYICILGEHLNNVPLEIENSKILKTQFFDQAIKMRHAIAHSDGKSFNVPELSKFAKDCEEAGKLTALLCVSWSQKPEVKEKGSSLNPDAPPFDPKGNFGPW